MRQVPKRSSRLVGLFFLIIGTLSGAAYADSIGPNCGSCDGSIYTLTYSGSALPDMDPLHETFQITLSVDTTSYTGGGVRIDNVAIKVSAQDPFAAVLSAAPGTLTDWSLQSSGLNANGCSNGGGGFLCVADSDANAPVSAITLAWTLDVTLDNGDLFTGANQASIKARYVDANGDKIGALLSENITLQTDNGGGGGTGDPVPEPSTVLLFGSGLAALALAGWKKRQAKK